jgi:glutamine amidotransferase
MCELLAMSARFPTTIHLSMDELGRHGGATGPHRDGWGIGFVQDGDAFLLREPEAASESRWLAFLQEHDLRSTAVLAHVRRATQGPRLLRNSQPFTRELGGRVHLFAHNGMLPGIEGDPRFATRRFRTIGDTDSEHAFCALLERLAPLWHAEVPSLDDRFAAITAFARALGECGPANFVYSDGDAIFAHAHRRRHDDGEIRAPGLHLLCRRCAAAEDGVPLAGISMPHDARQEVALVASVPLSVEPWEPLADGALVALRDGQVVRRG